MRDTYSIPAMPSRPALPRVFTSRPWRFPNCCPAQTNHSTNRTTSQPSTAIHAIDATSPSPITTKGQILARRLSNAFGSRVIARQTAYWASLNLDSLKNGKAGNAACQPIRTTIAYPPSSTCRELPTASKHARKTAAPDASLAWSRPNEISRNGGWPVGVVMWGQASGGEPL